MEFEGGFLGGGFNFFLFSSLFGEMIRFDEHIFQMGWNHQLDLFVEWLIQILFLDMIGECLHVQDSANTPKLLHLWIKSNGFFEGLNLGRKHPLLENACQIPMEVVSPLKGMFWCSTGQLLISERVFPTWEVWWVQELVFRLFISAMLVTSTVKTWPVTSTIFSPNVWIV